MNYMKRVMIVLLCCIIYLNIGLLYGSNLFVAHAEKKDFATVLQSELYEPYGLTATEEDIASWSLAIVTLRTDGFPDASIAGIIGNCWRECQGSWYLLEGYMPTQENIKEVGGSITSWQKMQPGKSYETTQRPGWSSGGGHGMCQWSFGAADALDKFAGSHDFPYVTIRHTNIISSSTGDISVGEYAHNCKIPSMAGQIEFLLMTLHDSPEVQGYGKSWVRDALVSDAYKTDNASTAYAAAKYFEAKYEVSADNPEERGKMGEKAFPVVQACDGVKGNVKSVQEDTNQMIYDLVDMRLWDEKEFIDFCEFSEMSIELPNRVGLSPSKLKEISAWKRDIENRRLEKYNRYPRAVFMFVGILIIVYSTFLYLAWQFDRINNFIDISLLSIISFKRFMASPDGISNYADTRAANKVLTHKDIIKVTLLGLLIGTLLISGKIFEWVSGVISWISEQF